MERHRLAGMRAFTIIWIGQMVSLLGSNMTSFVLPIWAYNKTHTATAVALTATFYFLPLVTLGPTAGALVDRINRKLIMLLAEVAARAATLGLLILYLSGRLDAGFGYIVAQPSLLALQVYLWSSISFAVCHGLSWCR